MTDTTKIYMAGDSTMSNVPAEPKLPRWGWGQAMAQLFPAGVVDNRSLSGRSTLSFITQGHWEKLISDVKPGDWVIIQFGHNDQKAQDPDRYTAPTGAYRENLLKFIHNVRDKQGLPVLATSLSRRSFSSEGLLLDTHGQYTVVVRELGARLDIPVLDLQHITADLIQQHGVEGSKKIFLWIDKGQYESLPDGLEDNTHLSRYGADLIAMAALKEAQKQGLGLTALAKTGIM